MNKSFDSRSSYRLSVHHASEMFSVSLTLPFYSIQNREIIKIFEHENLNTHTYKNIKKIIIFQTQISLECYFFLLINVKMPTIVGILTFMSRKNFMIR